MYSHSIKIPSALAVQPGDLLQLGQVTWRCIGTTHNNSLEWQIAKELPVRSVWVRDSGVEHQDPLIRDARAMDFSEVEALIQLGKVSRLTPSRLEIQKPGPTPRSLPPTSGENLKVINTYIESLSGDGVRFHDPQ